MVSVIADNPKIESEIKNLIDILVGAGSGFHSQLVIHEQGGGLGIRTAEPMEDGKEIIRLPRTVLMPGDQYYLDVSGENFIVSYPEHATLSDLQKRIIDKMYEIYNLTDKVRLHEKYSFLFSLKDAPELIDKLGEGRDFIAGSYQEWIGWIKAGMTEEQRRKLICNTYVKTRPLGYSDPVRESSVSMIMPVLDFMNHHWEGGTFSVGQGIRAGDLTMQTSQPAEGSSECFAHYGVMDAFDTLIRYDFVDEHAPIVRSVGLSVEGPAGEEIRIQNKLNFFYKKELSKDLQDLRRHIPDIVFDEDGRMTVSHLFLPNHKSRFALKRVLNMALEAYVKRHSKQISLADAKAWRVKTQERIIEANNNYYRDLLRFIEGMTEEKKRSFGVARVRDMALHQLARIGEYVIQE